MAVSSTTRALSWQAILAGGIVASLLATTLLALVAAASGAQIVLHVQYQGPRPIAGTDACPAGGPECIDWADLRYDRLSLGDAAGGYGYGYRFMDWLQNGYGYSEFDVRQSADGNTITIEIGGLTSGEYRMRVWLDQLHNEEYQDGIELFAFAEESAGDSVLDVLPGRTTHAYAVLSEVSAPLTGTLLFDNGDPATGVDVIARGPFGDDYVTTASLDGAFTFPGLPTGRIDALSYHVFATAPEHEPASTTVKLPTTGLALADPLTLTRIGVTLPLPLDAGWHLLSMPLVQNDMDAGTVFAGADAVYGWDGASYTALEADGSVVPGRAYWVYLSSAKTLNLSGSPLSNVTLNLPYAGWHLVGGPAGEAPLGDLPENVLPPLYGWDGVTYTPSDTFAPTRGYWLFVSHDSATLEVSS